MPEGDGTVLDNSCLLWLSNMWSGWKHDNMKLPVVTAGGLGGTIETGRVARLPRTPATSKRKVCSLYLSIMDRMGVTLDRFGDADTRPRVQSVRRAPLWCHEARLSVPITHRKDGHR